MHARFADHGQSVYAFGAEFLVRCPRCGGRAVVRPRPATEAPARLFTPRRLTCARCGYARDGDTGPLWIGGPVDWYFHQPLWLQTPCAGHTLWAYNAEHLAFLEGYVGAGLRQRRPNVNRSLASRLPRWLLDAKLRADVLVGTRRLREHLADDAS